MVAVRRSARTRNGQSRSRATATPRVRTRRREAVRGMSFDRTMAEILLMGAALSPTEPAGQDWHIAAALVDIAFEIEATGAGGAIWILPSSRSSPSEVEGLGQKIFMDESWWEPYKEVWENRTSTIRLLNPGCDQGHSFLQMGVSEFLCARRVSELAVG